MSKIDSGSVRILRSYDYSHFEVSLSSTEAKSPEAVDELRKIAARLVDKAVAQYQVAKINAIKLLRDKQQRQFLVMKIDGIRAKEEGSRTVREQADLKAFEDEQWQASRGYDYEDDWPDENEEY